MTFSHLTPVTYRVSEQPEQLRKQAAACRRLSSVARTTPGALAMTKLAKMFEADAVKADKVRSLLADESKCEPSENPDMGAAG